MQARLVAMVHGREAQLNELPDAHQSSKKDGTQNSYEHPSTPHNESKDVNLLGVPKAERKVDYQSIEECSDESRVTAPPDATHTHLSSAKGNSS